MKLVIGSDHGGYAMKEALKPLLQKWGHAVTDFGCHGPDPVDYPDIALLVGEAVARREFDRGILVDGFGGAVALAANKISGVRAVCAYDERSARFAAGHDDANIVCVGGKTMGELTVVDAVKAYLETSYEGGRHDRRLAKVLAIERKYQGSDR